jgi:hypothetical protein
MAINRENTALQRLLTLINDSDLRAATWQHAGNSPSMISLIDTRAYHGATILIKETDKGDSSGA